MRRPSPHLILLVALVALLAGACTVGVGTAPEDYVPPGGAGGGGGNGRGGGNGGEEVDLLVDGPEEAIADLRQAVGGERLRALELAIYPDSVYLEAQRPGDPTKVDKYTWDAADGVSETGEKDTSGIDLSTQLFPMSQVNLEAIPGLVAEAPERLGINGLITSSVIVKRAGGPVLTTVFVSTPRGANGAVVANQDGTVVGTS